MELRPTYLLKSGFSIAVLSIAVLLTGCDKPAPTANGGGAANTSTPTTGGEIVIGEYSSITGPEATFGKSTDEGIQLAVEEINKAGGIDGKQVRIKLEDDASDASKAETSVKRLLEDKSMVAVLGEVASSNSLAGGKVCQDNGVPMISPSSTAESVTQGRDYVFRVCFIDPYQGAVMARFATDSLKIKRVAVFTNKSAAYSVGLSKSFKDAFTKMGGQIVEEKTYGKDDKDFTGPLTAMKAASPEAIFVPGYYQDAGSIVKQARDNGITIPFLGGDGWDSDILFKVGGPAMNGCFITNHMSIQDPAPAIQNFVKTYQAKYGGKTPDALAALAYDSAKLLFDAIHRAGSTDHAKVRDAIAATKDYPGVTGNITIDEKHNAKKPAVVLEIKDQKLVYKATIADPDQPMKN